MLQIFRIEITKVYVDSMIDLTMLVSILHNCALHCAASMPR